MSAIYRKELKIYFSRRFGYAALSLMLLTGGLSVSAFNVLGGTLDLSYTMLAMNVLLIIAIPLLSMRTFAAEHLCGTDRFLFSLPLHTGSIVLGKYFATLTLFAIPSLISALFSLILSAWSNASTPTLLLAWLGYLLLGAALLAIGTWVSALCSRPLTAAIFGIIIMLGLYAISVLVWAFPPNGILSAFLLVVAEAIASIVLWRTSKSRSLAAIAAGVMIAPTVLLYIFLPRLFEGLFTNLLASIDLFNRYTGLTYGRLDLTTVLFYLGCVVFFLYLTARRVEHLRSMEKEVRA